MTRRRPRSSPIPARELADAPPDLRSTDLFLGAERFVVLQLRAPPEPRLPGLSPAESAVVPKRVGPTRAARVSGALTVVAYKNGEEWATATMETTGAPAAVSLEADRTTAVTLSAE